MSKIDYNLKKIKGVAFDIDGVLSPACVPLGADGNPQRMANVKDGYALRLAVKRGLKLCIISGARGEGLEERFRYLDIKDVYLKAGAKIDIFKAWMEREGLSAEETVFVGDDVPDRECMEAAGLAVAPSDACPDILSVADYISPCAGGYGVGRDVLEEILRAKGLWPVTDVAFG